jgi:DNA polymerase-1
MQNMPVHGGYRECFRPDPGFVFVGIDYSQQEYRLAGAVSGDKRIINAYKKGSDMHTATAQVLYKKDKVTKDERNRGKTVNFAILYGSTEFGLKKNLNISENEAKQIIDEFWKGYKYLSSFMEYAGEKIMELGFSSTPLGRRRYNLPRPVFMNSYELDRWKARVLREGKNHIIQGGGADILKLAMLRISRENPYGDKLRFCLQIHDELLFQIHESIKEEGALFAKNIMEEEEQKFLGEIPAGVDGWKEFRDRWSK